MKLPKEIESKLSSLFEICKNHKVNRLFVFGSVSTGKFHPKKSDLDLIVELDNTDPVEKGEALLKLWAELEELFGRKVDLIISKKIRNPFLSSEIEKSKKLLYDRAS